MPFLRKTVDLGCKAIDAGAGGRGMDAFKRLAGDFGKELRYITGNLSTVPNIQ